MTTDHLHLDAAVMANFRALCFLAADRANLPHDPHPALAWTRSAPSPWPGFVLSAEFPDPDENLRSMLDKMNSGLLPPRFLLTPDAKPADLEPRVLKAGFEMAVEWECMTCGAEDFRSPPFSQAVAHADSKDYEIIHVKDAADALHWARTVLSFLYGKPEDSAEPLAAIGRSLIGDPRIRLLLVRFQGVPAASATLFMHEGVGGLYHVSVGPALRRKGLGGHVTRAAAKTAFAQGCRGMILHASKMGAPLYKKLGFQSRFFVRGFRPGV